jgi:hypothetical protein
MARRKALGLGEQSKFNLEMLKAMAKDLATGKTPLDRVVLSDDLVTGLRAIVRKSGNVSLHASYHFDGGRPLIILGDPTLSPKDPNYISLADAREITKTIKHLAGNGIDPQEGARRRLLKELKRDGTAWRPK